MLGISNEDIAVIKGEMPVKTSSLLKAVPSGGTVEVIVELKSYTHGSLVNSVAASGEQNDPARSNNSASSAVQTATELKEQAEYRIEKD